MDTSAASRVFNIPELLEIILLNLQSKDLLLSQRTARSFHSTTQGSIKLRRKLFLEPDWNLEGRVFDAYKPGNRPGRKPENNRLLLKAFPGCYPTITLVILRDGISAGGQSTFSSLGRREEWSWDVCMSFPADRLPDVPAAVLRPEASWRKMLLSQPPCKSLYLVRRWQRGRHPAIVREGGVTMGDVFDGVTREDSGDGERKWHDSYISSDSCWHFEGPLQCNMIEQ
ncbi:uncharacterized protein RCC_09710 [Ramularia collo-cygni]|uniref:F-box domain-containing protein n=1 Tax=Ramularia collo-cygni TaxID=112498 RepID=A0A2D3V7M2_9PEZI|nr:uncharacterized protein RCC_09710 [Ramularia collo-cygni]CZT23993.1 uncharacterized protein RCC_09710 [Ramularia collo-cygni]